MRSKQMWPEKPQSLGGSDPATCTPRVAQQGNLPWAGSGRPEDLTPHPLARPLYPGHGHRPSSGVRGRRLRKTVRARGSSACSSPALSGPRAACGGESAVRAQGLDGRSGGAPGLQRPAQGEPRLSTRRYLLVPARGSRTGAQAMPAKDSGKCRSRSHSSVSVLYTCTMPVTLLRRQL